MKAWLTRDRKNKTAALVVKTEDVSDIVENVVYRDMMKMVAEKFVEEYYTDIIKRVDPKVLAAFITVEAAKKAVKE